MDSDLLSEAETAETPTPGPKRPPISLRCSSLGRAFSCPGSLAALDSHSIGRETGRPAVIGKAVHDLLADVVQGDVPMADNACARLGITDAAEIIEVETLLSAGISAWRELKVGVPLPRVEIALEADVAGLKLTGTADVLSPVGEYGAIVIDWKSSHDEAEHHHQLAGYAYATWCILGKHSESVVTTVVVHLRYRTYTTVIWTAAHLQAWEGDLRRNVLANAGTMFRPGSACTYCPAYHGCAARLDVVRAVVSGMTLTPSEARDKSISRMADEVAAMLADITPGQAPDPLVGGVLGDILSRIRLVQRAVDDARDHIRQLVTTVGPIDLRDGTELRVTETKVNEVVAIKAMKVLRKLLSDADIFTSMKVSLTKLTDQMAVGMPPGQKGLARRTLVDELARNNAITTRIVKRLSVVDLAAKPITDDKESEE